MEGDGTGRIEWGQKWEQKGKGGNWRGITNTEDLLKKAYGESVLL